MKIDYDSKGLFFISKGLKNYFNPESDASIKKAYNKAMSGKGITQSCAKPKITPRVEEEEEEQIPRPVDPRPESPPRNNTPVDATDPKLNPFKGKKVIVPGSLLSRNNEKLMRGLPVDPKHTFYNKFGDMDPKFLYDHRFDDGIYQTLLEDYRDSIPIPQPPNRKKRK